MESIDVGGQKVAFHRRGNGPPLVLVHGAGDDGRIWQPQLAGLSDEFTVVAWDEPGSGKSSRLTPDFALSDFADTLAAMIRALDLGPTHIAGHSWGGTVVLELYRRHPHLVASLILIDSYAGWKGSLPADEVTARVAQVREALDSSPAQSDLTFPGLFAHEPPAELVPLLADIAAGVRIDTLQQELTIMAEADLSELLPQIAVPTLLIWGEDDVRSPLEIARQFNDSIHGSSLVVIPDAGHMTFLEQPTQVNDAIRQFCRAHPIGRAT